MYHMSGNEESEMIKDRFLETFLINRKIDKIDKYVSKDGLISSRKMLPNQAILKNYGGVFYKVTHFKSLRVSGVEVGNRGKSEKNSVNDQKLTNNISRARSTVFELATCNPWKFWCTFTLDKEKYDRTNISKFRKDFSQYIRDLSKKHKTKINYLLVPELHKDGVSWHMHGFMDNLPESELRKFTLTEKLPNILRKKIKNGDSVWDWTGYRKRFGFNDLELVRNQEACSKYITKYLSKNMSSDVKDLGAHLYYCSIGLKRAEEIKRGTIVAPLVSDYENDYVRVSVFKPDEISLDALCHTIESVGDIRKSRVKERYFLRVVKAFDLWECSRKQVESVVGKVGDGIPVCVQIGLFTE